MQFRHHALCAAAAILWLTGCDKPPASATHATADKQLVEARDALQRQALEIETKTALMEKRVAEMERSLKEQENAGLRTSLNALQQENEDLRAQAEDLRRQSDALSQRLVDEAPPPSSVVQQPAPAPDYSLFYESLALYGSWLEVAGYGYCWQPTVSMAGWRPYWDGCWVWSEFGWAWLSNEPFGWLTYHYGRWVELSQYGWVWVPGSEWAPGWVAWRQSPDCVGWAPLPPEPGVCDGVYRDCDSRYSLGPTSYVFIPITQFVSPTYISVYAPVTQYTTIYRQSVNVTQIVPRSGHRHAFVQQGGPPRAQMEQACGRGVPQRTVQVVQAGQMPPQQHGYQRADSAMLLVDLPAAGPGVRVVRPEIREHVLHPMPVRGIAGGAAAETPQSPAIVRQKPDLRSQEPPLEESARYEPTAPGPVPQEMVRPAVAAEQAIAGQQAQAAEQDQHRQQELNERAMADRRAAEQAAVAQQQQEAANQQHMTAEQERTRRAAEATVMQQQQEESNRRAAEEQMRTRQETERRTQEMARRQAEEQTRRAAEEQMKAQQESERLARQEAAQRAQEMAQRQAEEQARRAAEEQSRRAAEEQMKARQEAAQRAQEMARHQAEEQARRATEEASRRAQEEAHRAAESARNQPSRP